MVRDNKRLPAKAAHIEHIKYLLMSCGVIIASVDNMRRTLTYRALAPGQLPSQNNLIQAQTKMIFSKGLLSASGSYTRSQTRKWQNAKNIYLFMLQFVCDFYKLRAFALKIPSSATNKHALRIQFPQS